MKLLLVIMAIFTAQMALAAEMPQPIFGYIADAEGVSVATQSNGCTDKTHFTPVRLNPGYQPAQIALARSKRDDCRRAPLPYGQILKFTFEEIGLQKGEIFLIVNPLLPAQAN